MFRQSRKKRLQERKVDTLEISRKAEYPFRLSFYSTPPLLEITVEEFERWAIDRLKVLGEIEACQLRNRSQQEIEKQLKTLLDEYMPLGTNSSTRNIDEERKKDQYSHFILRLAFCRSQELRDRFVRLETALFKMRYNTDSIFERQQFVESLDFPWEQVDAKELEAMEKILGWQKEKEFFKVDFEQVPDLVANRMVSLHKGKAYIPASLQITLVVGEFQARLKRDLEMTARAIPRLDEDDRLIPILNHLALGMPAPVFNAPKDGEGIKAEQVDGLAKNKHFPLCMKHMHMTSTADAHAFYPVRQQYGAFLKGIGLSVDESLKFWRQFVFKRLTDDDFNKRYAYNVRHMYALEGSRIDFQPMDCVQITRSQGSGHHGCPYRTFSPQNLTASLNQMGIHDHEELGRILKLVEEQKYHVACTSVYELTHPDDQTEYQDSIVHPNIYFERSFKHLKKQQEGTQEKGGDEPQHAQSEPQLQPEQGTS